MGVSPVSSGLRLWMRHAHAKSDHRRFVHYGYTLCSLHPTLSVGLNAQSPVYRAPRGRQPPLQPEPGALAPGGDCANVMRFDLVMLWTVGRRFT